MAVTTSLYNGTTAFLANKGIANMTLKIMLLGTGATFDATETTLDQVDGSGDYEVYGNGWSQGGMTLSNVTVSTVTTNDAKIDADNVEVTASAGPIGPAIAAVIYDDSDSNNRPLQYIDFDGEQEAGDGTDFNIIFDASGFITLTYT